MNWVPGDIIAAIEAIHWDYEDDYPADGVTVVKTPSIYMQKVDGTSSPGPQRVVRTRFGGSDAQVERQIDEVFAFYQGRSFCWWIGPQERPADLKQHLLARGMEPYQVYAGLACVVSEERELTLGSGDGVPGRGGLLPASYRIVAVDLDNGEWYVAASAAVWGYNEQSQQHRQREVEAYLELPGRRGGQLVVLKDGDGEGSVAAGYANYRFSGDGRVLYLTGAGVLPEHRHQGVYHALLAARLKLAAERGCKLAVIQANLETSAPILKSNGFEEYGRYEVLVGEPGGE